MVKPCSRVASSFTGRPMRRAAKAISAVRWVIEPREPNAPPTWCEITCTSAGSMPSCCATPWASPRTFWLASQMVSLPPSQAQAVVNSSIGLWCWVGVPYHASIFAGAAS